MGIANLKHQTWYWLSLASEGDIFYPVFVVDDQTIKVDGFEERLSDFSDATFDEAILPSSNK